MVHQTRYIVFCFTYPCAYLCGKALTFSIVYFDMNKILPFYLTNHMIKIIHKSAYVIVKRSVEHNHD